VTFGAILLGVAGLAILIGIALLFVLVRVAQGERDALARAIAAEKELARQRAAQGAQLAHKTPDDLKDDLDHGRF